MSFILPCVVLMLALLVCVLLDDADGAGWQRSRRDLLLFEVW